MSHKLKSDLVDGVEPCINKKKPQQDLTGSVFGKLTVIGPAPEERRKKNFTWSCQCECGKLTFLETGVLKSGHSKSCGCGNLENKIKNCSEGRIKRTENRKDPRLQLAKWLYNKNYSDGDLTFDEFLELSQQNCYYCGSPPSNKLRFSSKKYTEEYKEASLFVYNGIDAIKNDKPHNKDNILPCCKNCNFSKRNRDLDEFLDWIQRVNKNLNLGG